MLCKTLKSYLDIQFYTEINSNRSNNFQKLELKLKKLLKKRDLAVYIKSMKIRTLHKYKKKNLIVIDLNFKNKWRILVYLIDMHQSTDF